MVLVKEKVVIKAPKGKKPTRFRFKGKVRIGFRKNEVVEVVQFKEKKKVRRKKK